MFDKQYITYPKGGSMLTMKKTKILMMVLVILSGCGFKVPEVDPLPLEPEPAPSHQLFNRESGIMFDASTLTFLLFNDGEIEHEHTFDISKINEAHHHVVYNEKTYNVQVNVEAAQAKVRIGEHDYVVIESMKDVRWQAEAGKEPTTQNIVSTTINQSSDETHIDIMVHVKKDGDLNPERVITKDDVVFIKGHIIVNKRFGIPSNYAPGENPEAASQLRKLIRAMRENGLRVHDSYSGYRSYSVQKRLYNNYVRDHGAAEANRFSAKPGHSEHQTGLTFDLKAPDGHLLRIEPEITWVRNNAHLFGFVVRYPKGKEHITGYIHEPWHLRYMGSEAPAIFESGLTLEEYFEIPG